MTDKKPCARFVVMCVDDDPAALEALRRDTQTICGAALEVDVCADANEALERALALRRDGACIPLVIADYVMPGMTGAEFLIALHDAGFRTTRKVLLSGQSTLEPVTKALNRGALDRHLVKPWTVQDLRDCVRDLLTDFLLEVDPEGIDRFADLIDVAHLSQAYRQQKQRLRALDTQLKAVQRSFLTDVEMSDEMVEQAMIEGLDTALGRPPRTHLPPGSLLLEEGQTVDGISILEQGQVRLSRRVGGHEISFHSQSAGKIIGLLSLAHRRKAFFTCRAVTDVTIVPLSLERLNEALQKNPMLSIHFVTVLVRTLAKRNRRVTALTAKIERLNSTLSDERDHLRAALAQLEMAQMRLVESEKLATLGQLSAGVAHELNNPVAAMQRAVDFIGQDIIALVNTRPEGEALQAVTLSALTSAPMSTRAAREKEAALAADLGDPALARRLVKVGLTSADDYRRRFGHLTLREAERLLVLMERYHQLGTSLRNITRCADHISAIVKSLRSYARPDTAPVADVNVHEGIEDTLLMLGHLLRDVEVVKRFGDLPSIECHAGEINQLWTNLITNALQAMEDKPRLCIETDAPDPNHVRVRIIDNGRGIPPEQLERVFDTNFTTKIGHAQFGLGLGLPICRQIVTRHGGSITLESREGETVATVILPVRYSHIPGERRPR